jgi:hypothetical protein
VSVRKRTKFRMFLWGHPYLRHKWLLLVEFIGKKLWDLAGIINGYYHDSTSFYFMLGVGGEEKYKTLGEELVRNSQGEQYAKRG